MAKWSQACAVCRRHSRTETETNVQGFNIVRVEVEMVEGLGCFLVRLACFQSRHDLEKIAGRPCVPLPRWVSNATNFFGEPGPRIFRPSASFHSSLPVAQLPQHRLRLREGASVERGPEPQLFHLREAVKTGLVGRLCRWYARS